MSDVAPPIDVVTPTADVVVRPDVSTFESGIPACPAGQSRCDTECVDTATSVTHCGACGNVCAVGANATVSCVAGACALRCAAGFANCDSTAANGCESVSATDTANCGACGNACPAPSGGTATCAGGTCGVVCPGTQSVCSGACVALDTNSNCGACGSACAAGTMCSDGSCVALSTTLAFPSSASVLAGPGGADNLGNAIASGAARFRAGDYVEQSFMASAPYSMMAINLSMNDRTTGCAVGRSNSWDVLINGTRVGSYSYVSSTPNTARPISTMFVFPGRPAGAVTIRYIATTTVCLGGSSWLWNAPGTVTLN